MEEKAPLNTKSIVILLLVVILIVFNMAFKKATAMSKASSGCKALPLYVAESCAAGDWVFDGFRVCCDFLGRASAECLTAYLPEFAAAGVEDVSLFNGCLNSLLPGRSF